MCFQHVLALAAHADDCELGCGGFLARYAPCSEITIGLMTLTRRAADGTLLEERDLTEVYAALAALGLPQANLFLPSGLDGQIFPEQRQKLLEVLYQLDRDIKPDLVLVPSNHDVHQDHVMLCDCARKAFKRCTLWGYPIPNSIDGFQPQVFVELDADIMRQKCQAVSAYRSQLLYSTGDYFSPEVTQAVAQSYGVRAGFRYAEAFEVYTWQMPLDLKRPSS